MHGMTVGHSSTGCRQGDPLSSLCFCVGIHGVLEEAVAAMRTLIEGHIGSSTVGGLFAYIDDITFFYDGCLSSPMEATLRRIFASHQIPLNMAKCYHLVHPSSELSAGPHQFPIQSHGEPILGCPTGTAEFRRSFAAAKVAAATSSLPALALLQPWSTWNLLRSCVSSRLGYLARVLEPADTTIAFSLFDDRIDEAVFGLASLSDPTDKHIARWLRGLPLDLNGLGLPRYNGLAGDTACLLSRQATYDFLERHFPELLAGARLLWTPIRPGSVEDALFLAPARVLTNAISPPTPATSPLHLSEDIESVVVSDPGLDFPSPPTPPRRPSPQPTSPEQTSPVDSPSPPSTLPRHLSQPRPSHSQSTSGEAVSHSSDDSPLPCSDPPFYIPPLVVRSMVMASGESCIMAGVEDPNDSLEIRRLARSIGRPQESNLPTSARPTRRAIYRSLSTGLTRFLCASGRTAEACMHRASCYKGSGRSLVGPGSSVYFGRLAFRNGSEYRTMLRMRLLLSPASSDVGDVDGIVSCRCGMRFHPREQPFHALDCSASQWRKIQRHNLVRDLLIQFLRRHTPHRVEPEPAVGSLNGTPFTAADNLGEFDILHTSHRRRERHRRRRRTTPQPTTERAHTIAAWAADRARQLRAGHFRADLGVYPSTGGRIIIDVAVGNPAALSYRTRPADRPPHHSSYDPVGASYATEHRENAKIYRYRKLSGVDADDPNSFVPFAMDASGRLGARASAFLGRILADSPCAGARTELETQLSAAMARYNALASLAWARQLVRDAPHL